MNPIFKTLTPSLSRSFASNSRLQIFDQGGRVSSSGIRATIFGATGFMGPYIGSAIGYIGSDLIFPHSHHFTYDDEVKELKLCAGTGQSYLVKHMDFDDLKMIDRVIANSNVVINLLGPRKKVKSPKDFEYINRTVPRRIAQACARNKNVVRLVHFSAVGADQSSQSQDFRTKALGELDVMEAFPNATILKPTTVYGPNDYFMRLWLSQKNFFYNFNVVTDDCKAKRQPIFVTDVAMATLNALKLHETCGKTYELGGPNVYSMLEIYEIYHNIVKRPPKLAYFNHDWAVTLAKWLPNFRDFNLETILKNTMDIVVDEKARKINELYVQPVGFTEGVERFLHDSKAAFFGKQDEEEQ